MNTTTKPVICLWSPAADVALNWLAPKGFRR